MDYRYNKINVPGRYRVNILPALVPLLMPPRNCMTEVFGNFYVSLIFLSRRETHIINCWEIKEMSIEEKKVAAWGLATHLCNGCLI